MGSTAQLAENVSLVANETANRTHDADERPIITANSSDGHLTTSDPANATDTSVVDGIVTDPEPVESVTSELGGARNDGGSSGSVSPTLEASVSIDGGSASETPADGDGFETNVSVAASAGDTGTDGGVNGSLSSDRVDLSARGSLESTSEETLTTISTETEITATVGLDPGVQLTADGQVTVGMPLRLQSQLAVDTGTSATDGAPTDSNHRASGPTRFDRAGLAHERSGDAGTDERPVVGQSDLRGPPAGPSTDPGSSMPLAPIAGGVLAFGGVVAVRFGSTAEQLTHAPALARSALRLPVAGLRSELPKVLALIGYSRYDDSDPLEHEVRAELHEVVQDSPGIHLSALGERAPVSLSSVRHHLRVLEEESLVSTERIDGKRRYFPAETEDTALVAALDDPARADVLRIVAANEGATVSDIAEALGRDPSTVSHHLSKLEAADLVERERAGRTVRTRLAPRIEGLLPETDGLPTGSPSD